jgi:hypothetical protein
MDVKVIMSIELFLFHFQHELVCYLFLLFDLQINRKTKVQVY